MKQPSKSGYVRPSILPARVPRPPRLDGTYGRRMCQEPFGAPATLCQIPTAFPTSPGSAWDRWQWTSSSTRLPRWPKPISPRGSIHQAYGLQEGEGHPFNLGLLVCIPKKVDEHHPQHGAVYTAEGTRPLSIVDIANRILANAYRYRWQPTLAAWVSPEQRGFYPGAPSWPTSWT